MSHPSHHLDDDVLLAYVSGTTTEPVALVAACHLTLCAVCRERASAAEAVGGVLLETAQGIPLSESAFDRALARLDDDGVPAPPVPSVPSSSSAPFVFGGVPLPRALVRYLNPDGRTDGPQAAFRFLAPGIRGIDLPMVASGAVAVVAGGAVRTRLLRLESGLEIPRHAHAAPEFTLVFSGGLSDGGEHYGRGDLRFRDTTAVHSQVVDPGGPCLALVVNEGALLPQTWRGKLISFLFDR
ncbi:MAG: cupin domain-containing protein [Pseudomonadota bacterium]